MLTCTTKPTRSTMFNSDSSITPDQSGQPLSNTTEIRKLIWTQKSIHYSSQFRLKVYFKPKKNQIESNYIGTIHQRCLMPSWNHLSCISWFKEKRNKYRLQNSGIDCFLTQFSVLLVPASEGKCFSLQRKVSGQNVALNITLRFFGN